MPIRTNAKTIHNYSGRLVPAIPPHKMIAFHCHFSGEDERALSVFDLDVYWDNDAIRYALKPLCRLFERLFLSTCRRTNLTGRKSFH